MSELLSMIDAPSFLCEIPIVWGGQKLSYSFLNDATHKVAVVSYSRTLSWMLCDF